MICKKVSFATENDAIFYIKKLKETSVRIKKPTRSYCCPICFGWHLTSQDSKDDARMAEMERKQKIYKEQVSGLTKTYEKLKKEHHELRYNYNQLLKKIDEKKN